MNESATVLILLKQWDRITDRDGVLYRKITMPNCDNERPRADDDWVEKHQRRLRDAHRMARVHLQQHADDRKQRYDRRAGDLPLAVGDFYLRNRQVRGRNKIQDVWDSAVYKVVCRQGVNHMYTVEREDGLGTMKTINRADIRVCTQDPETPGIARRRRLPCTPGSSTDVTDSDSSVGTSDRPLLYVVNRSHDERPSSRHATGYGTRGDSESVARRTAFICRHAT